MALKKATVMDEPTEEINKSPDELGLDEIEAAYLRAMEATESLDTLLPATDPIISGTSIPLGVDGSERPPEVTNEKVDSSQAEPEQQVTSQQVIEALLFVGSAPLPARKIVELIGGSTTHEQIDEFIEQLNEQYRSQCRPYEICLVEGGYQMGLKTEFETVRRRVYGQGPKDVKLNQETLEVLAFVAYQQPTPRTRLDELGKKNVGSLLRQLLRRQLILLERSEETGEENYKTTKRFLELFGLTSISDLPQAMDFNFK